MVIIIIIRNLSSSIMLLCNHRLALELKHSLLLHLCLPPASVQLFHTTGSGTRCASHASCPFRLRRRSALHPGIATDKCHPLAIRITLDRI